MMARRGDKWTVPRKTFKTEVPPVGNTPNTSKTSAKSSAELYLERTSICMRQADAMTSFSSSSSPKFNHVQCKYLAHKLSIAVQYAHLFFKKFRTKLSCVPAEDMAQSLEIFKLLFALSKEVESIILGCCKEEWIQSAIMLTNSWEHVSSIGFNLEFCAYVFSSSEKLRAIPSLTHEAVARASKAEAASVKEMANHDERRLSRDLHMQRTIMVSNPERQLATFLLERLNSTRLHPGSESPGSFQSLSHPEIMFSGLKRLERLGSGASGTVHKAIWLGAEVASKSFHGPGNPDFVQEVSILAGLYHPNIVRLFWYTADEHKCHIIMELMDKDLNTLMEDRLDSGIRNHPPFTVTETLDIMLQVAQGVLFLHEKSIVHRDLKSYNILVKLVKTSGVDITYMHVKVADFGLARTKERSVTYSNQTQNVGTARWMAPEIIKIQNHDGGQVELPNSEKMYPFKSDVYSFGMVCYEILTGRVPFSTVSSPNEVKKMVLRGLRPQLPEHCPSKLRTLIEACWSPEASTRPRFGEICAQLREMRCAHLLTTMWDALAKAPRRFSLDEIRRMTNGFHRENLLQSISYREVYKGIMVDTHEVVAVDRINYTPYFKRKLEVLPGLDHNNVVRCVGFCEEDNVLLYDDMPTSTLSDWHEGDKDDMNHIWAARKRISFGVAYGIHYLHTVPKMSHRAIHPDDILLNDNLEPKLTGLGWTIFNADVVSSAEFVFNLETYGGPWRAPEYDIGNFSEKVDVYSYGLVLLEVVTGTRVDLPNGLFRGSYKRDHLEWAWTLHLEGKSAELIDHTLNLQPHESIEAVRMINIAFLCLHSKPETRPDMSLVVEMLHGNWDAEILSLGLSHRQEMRR